MIVPKIYYRARENESSPPLPKLFFIDARENLVCSLQHGLIRTLNRAVEPRCLVSDAAPAIRIEFKKHVRTNATKQIFKNQKNRPLVYSDLDHLHHLRSKQLFDIGKALFEKNGNERNLNCSNDPRRLFLSIMLLHICCRTIESQYRNGEEKCAYFIKRQKKYFSHSLCILLSKNSKPYRMRIPDQCCCVRVAVICLADISARHSMLKNAVTDSQSVASVVNHKSNQHDGLCSFVGIADDIL